MKSPFRSIRQTLFREGKLLRYLGYALGEILLIVVGILLALKISDWNEEQKAREVETKILQEIRSNLILDLEEIREDISLLVDVQTSCSNVIRFVETEDKPTKAFQMNVGNMRITPHFDPNRSGYDLLKSKGVEIVLNDSLRRSISDLYESTYTYYYRYEEERTQFMQIHVTPITLNYFIWNWDKRPDAEYKDLDYGNFYAISLEDYARLKNDPAFFKAVHAVNFEYSIIQDRAERTEGIIVELVGQLNEELGGVDI